jgi:hypothetical protein
MMLKKKFRKKDEKDVQITQYYEYLDKQAFLEFLYKGNENTDGVLQKYIECKGDEKTILSMIWSNKLCFFEKRIIYTENDSFHTKTVPIRGNMLPDRMQSIAKTIK